MTVFLALFDGALLREPLLEVEHLVQEDLRVPQFMRFIQPVFLLEPVDLALHFLSCRVAGAHRNDRASHCCRPVAVECG